MLLPIHLKITFPTTQTVPNADLGQLNFRLLNYLYECAMGLYDSRVCLDCLIAYDAYIGSHIGCALLIQLSGLFFPFICSTTPASPTVIDQLKSNQLGNADFAYMRSIRYPVISLYLAFPVTLRILVEVKRT